MLNREKYAKEIIEIACNGGNIAVVNGKLENCRKTQCNECNFNGGTIRDCEIKTRKWANSEYVEPIEPQVDWSRVPVDTPILVRHSESCGWDRRYFAKYNNGLVYAWKQGTTSWSAEDPAYVCDWKYAKLATNQIKKENKTMKTEFTLNLDSLTDLNNFVMEISSQIPCDVDAKYGRQVVDAKSYLGLVTISIHPVTVVINTDNEDYIKRFNEICSKYKIVEE